PSSSSGTSAPAAGRWSRSAGSSRSRCSRQRCSARRSGAATRAASWAPRTSARAASSRVCPRSPRLRWRLLWGRSCSGVLGPAGELLAQRRLAELADARLGDLVDEGVAVGQPPAREVRREEGVQLLAGDRLSLGGNDDGERALVPLLVGDRDHRSL